MAEIKTTARAKSKATKVASKLLAKEFEIKKEEQEQVLVVIENPLYNQRTGEQLSSPQKCWFNRQGWLNWLSTGGQGNVIHEFLHGPDDVPKSFEEYNETVKAKKEKQRAARKK